MVEYLSVVSADEISYLQSYVVAGGVPTGYAGKGMEPFLLVSGCRVILALESNLDFADVRVELAMGSHRLYRCHSDML